MDASIHLHGTPGWLAEAFGSDPGAGSLLLPTGNAQPDPGIACWPLIQAHPPKKERLTTMSTIIAPYDLERCCRAALAAHPRHSALALRIVIAASSMAGTNWVPLHDVQATLKGFKQRTYRSGVLAKRMKCLGIVDTRKVAGCGFSRIEMKVNCDLFHVSHPHGQVSSRIRSALDTFGALHPSATHLAGLFLLGIHAYHIRNSRTLGQFLGTVHEVKFKQSSTPGRLLNDLADARLLSIRRNSHSLSRPFTVFPVAQ